MKKFLAGLLLGSVAPVAAEPVKVVTLCHKVILPYVVNCSKKATLTNGYTPAICNRV